MLQQRILQIAKVVPTETKDLMKAEHWLRDKHAALQLAEVARCCFGFFFQLAKSSVYFSNSWCDWLSVIYFDGK